MFILRTNEGRQKGIETYNGIKFKILEKKFFAHSAIQYRLFQF